MWCVPTLDAEFIARMEDLLSLYAKPLKSFEPVVCLDEKPVQLLADVRHTRRRRDGSRIRDYEYRRCGTANIFCMVEPLAGRHFLKVTRRRAKPDFARCVRDLVRRYPRARTIHLVMDNLSTHSFRALEETFGGNEAKRLWRRLTVHFTPKHGSWLNQAETQISMVSNESLGDDRFADISEIRRRVGDWRRAATRQRRRIRWGFTVRKARKKFGYLKRGSPSG
jgi:transposase